MNKLIDLEKKQIKTIQEIKKEKQRLHIEFMKIHRKEILIIDIIIILLVLMNMGAVVITNILAVKKDTDAGKEITFNEVNPTQAAINNYELHPEYATIIKKILIQFCFWLVLISMYVWHRNKIYTQDQMLVLWIVVIFYMLTIKWDFLNDLGLLIGSRCYG